MSAQVFGQNTRKVYSVWYGRVGTTNSITSDQVQQVFNDMDLYPSKSQVYEMLQCAKECANRSTAAYLTFGEFCVFATELKRCYEKGISRPMQVSKKNGDVEEKNNKKRNNKNLSGNESDDENVPKYEVFLGGSCNPTTWRQDTAIPVLKKLGITFYNPQVSHWGPELVELEWKAKQHATVLFFVMDNETRSVASLIETAHSAGKQRKLILVINPYKGPGQEICGEFLSQQEYADLSAGQTILQDLVERQGIPVFDSIPVALNCTAKILRENLSVQDLSLKDFAQPVKMAHVQLGDKLIKLRETFDALDHNGCGQLNLADVCMAFRILTGKNLSMKDLRSIVASQRGVLGKDVTDVPLEQQSVSFEQFCSIMAEFKMRESEIHNSGFHNQGGNSTPTTNSSTAIVPVSSGMWGWMNSLANQTAMVLSESFSGLIEWVTGPSSRSPLSRSPTSTNNVSISQLPSCLRDVYLGGSASNSNWRDEIAIPILKKNGLSYVNPQRNSGSWGSRLVPIEAAAMDASWLLLFVITNTCRAVAPMAMASHYIGLGCNIILCVQYLPDDCVIDGEKLSKQAIKDYNRGRMYLSDLANRDGVPVFENVTEAVQCAVTKCLNR
ncbi:uncharacterized protein LOC132201798 isoform X4 [Neocloeon triangulifer]|uniref:uncharacterized protein LOC132201798 isoform X4 n=1 Tax=Neocloeon triangulifer TaxID=2078957 RepID=UPI00286F641C|nr:uncharacterized protein LOC132201798 isoform X4 [Neocloeon triangulifer]